MTKMNIYEALRHDHEKQRTLIDLLCKTHGDSEGRQELFEKLKRELEAHALAEERHFYSPLMQSDISQEKARHSVAEHEEMDELLEKLEEEEFSSPGWLPTAKKLAEQLIHHLDEEEQEVFQIAGKALTIKQSEELAKEYENQMEALREEHHASK